MFMTLRRLRGLTDRSKARHATPADLQRAIEGLVQRHRERGPSKLARRMRRKQQLGRAGAF